MRNSLARPRGERGSILVLSTVGLVLAMICAGLAIGTVRVGSSLVAANGTIPSSEVPILNKLVSGLIGGSYSTSAVGWQGLTSSNVTFGALTSALGGVTGNGT